MPTARTMAQDALELLTLYAPGEEATPPDIARMWNTLNQMLAVWSNESLACYAWTSNSFNLVVNQSDYTIGQSVSADINARRPLRVSNDPGSAYLTDQYGNKYYMDVLDQMSWNLRTSSAVNSNLPDTLLYDPQFPLGVIKIWPIPSEVYLCTFSSYEQLESFSSLDADVTFPPGYDRAIITNLAVIAKPYFPKAVLDQITMKEAMDTKGTIKRNNIRAKRSIYDPEIIARGSSTYNIKSDANY